MKKIDGNTKLCGLIGNPIGHTLSPLIHNTLAEKEGRNLVYVPFQVAAGKVKSAVEGAYALNFLGLNVTVPYKSEVISSLKEMDEMAEKIGAVNTLVLTRGGYKGYNTDMMGLYRAMCSENIKVEGEEIILLGAGGAARAVAFLCAAKGAERVYVLNRTFATVRYVAEEVNKAFGRECIIPMQLKDYPSIPADRKYLAIQATSVGLYPDSDKAVITDEDFYSMIHTGVDVIYKPFETKFMSLVKSAGGQAYNGLKMLLYQGIIAYELWNDVQIQEKDVEEIFALMKKELTE